MKVVTCWQCETQYHKDIQTTEGRHNEGTTKDEIVVLPHPYFITVKVWPATELAWYLFT